MFWGAQARKGVGLHNQQDEFDELLRLEFRTLDTKRPRWLKQRHPHIGLLLFARSGWFLFLVQKIPRLDFHHFSVAFQWPRPRAGALTAKEMEPLISELKVLALPSETFIMPRLWQLSDV